MAIDYLTDPTLVAGWEPTVPVADTFLRRFVRALGRSSAGPVEALGGTVVSTDDFTLTDLGRPAPFHNTVTLLRPVGDPDRLGDELATVLHAGRGTVWLWSAWPVPDLGSWGWRLSGHPPLLLRPPAPVDLPPPPPELEIRPVTDRDGLADWLRVVAVAFPLLGLAPGGGADPDVLRDPDQRLWVGYVDGRPVSSAAAYHAHGLNLFATGATLPAFRGRGYWRAMVRRRLLDAPDAPAAALFSDHSRGPAERLGFLPLLRFTAAYLERP